MKKLTSSSFEKAKSFIIHHIHHGRELDRRLFKYHFESGTTTGVLEVLALYQNDVGGFGHALEPDLRTPVSSAYTTSQGLFILRDIYATHDEAIVRKAITYLLNMHYSERNVWHIIAPEAMEAPHAGHWNYEKIEYNFGGFVVLPRVEIAGHLHHYSDMVPAEFLAKVTTAVLEHLQNTSDGNLGSLLNIYLDLVEADGFPESEKNMIIGRFRRVASDHTQSVGKRQNRSGRLS